ANSSRQNCKAILRGSDDATHRLWGRWIASRSLSSGGHSPDPLARNDEGRVFAEGGLRRHRLGEVVRDLVEEAGGGQPALVGADQEREVLGHVAFLDGGDADLFQLLGELRELRIIVELGAVREAA